MPLPKVQSVSLTVRPYPLAVRLPLSSGFEHVVYFWSTQRWRGMMAAEGDEMRLSLIVKERRTTGMNTTYTFRVLSAVIQVCLTERRTLARGEKQVARLCFAPLGMTIIKRALFGMTTRRRSALDYKIARGSTVPPTPRCQERTQGIGHRGASLRFEAHALPQRGAFVEHSIGYH
jgi:hypothetical protein